MTALGVRPPAAPGAESEARGGRAVGPRTSRTTGSWWWLLLAAVLLPFANLQSLVPVVAWVAPVLLLRFSRTQRLRVSVPALVLVLSLTSLVGLRGGFFPVEGGLGAAVLVGGIGVAGAVPYVVDRWVTPRLPLGARTLVFPTATTAIEFLATVGNPFGTAGSTAYSQYANLPMVQLVSVTGIWGVTFLVCWFASVVNEVWESGLSGSSVRRAGLPFAAALSIALVFGGFRLAFLAPTAPTVRVAALAPDRELSDLAFASAAGEGRTTQDRAAVRDSQLRPVLEDLFRRSAEEARAGAKIISWSEAAALVLQEDQPAVVARAAELARQQQVYLQISMIVLLSEPDRQRGVENENHAVLLDPTGAVVWDYLKSRPTPGDGHAPGPGVLPVVDTPYGRLSTAICQDDFFPGLLRQAGRADVDILLLPSSDWASVSAWHAQQAPFRAVENGVALVRATRQGTSLATDGQGRLLGHKADYFVGDDQTLVASVPTRGQDPAYAFTGDALAYLSLLTLLLILGWRALPAGLGSRSTPGAQAADNGVAL